MKMRRILIIAVILMFAHNSAGAQEEDGVQRYNDVIDAIYTEIASLKPRYPELSNFSKSAVKDSKSYHEIAYSHKPIDASVDDPYPFRFSLKVKDLRDTTEDPDEAPSEWEFPLLGFNVSLETDRGDLATFDPLPIVEKHLENLRFLEQKALPVRLQLSSDKNTYSPHETITLKITLTNSSAQSFTVMDLSEESLYCRIDDMAWGTKSSPEEAEQAVLPRHGTLTKTLRIQGISDPKEASISCRYGMRFRGVTPFDRITVLVKPAS
jgi:hypothetical protein